MESSASPVTGESDDRLSPQGVTMNPQKPKQAIVRGDGDDCPAPSLRRVVRKSALLNFVIVATSCPVLISAGGPKAVYPTVAIMAGISVLIWTATFALFSFASFPRIFRAPVSRLTQGDSSLPAEAAGIADRWLDGPA
jgi:hypothetical protein